MNRIFAVLIGLIVLPRLLRSQNVVEEIATIEDFNPTPVFNQGSDDLVPGFCTLNSANEIGTAHFSITEFHSKDGTFVPFSIRGNVQILMEQLEVIRQNIGAPIIITSGYRSPLHNQAVGGTATSYHQCGMAADFYSPGVSNDVVQQIILSLIERGEIIDGGLGRYNNFTHYDIGESRRWDKR